MTDTGTPAPAAPTVGAGATEHLYTDSLAYLVTRVSPNGANAWVRRVRPNPATRRETNPGAPWPCVVHDGDLDAPYGDEIELSRRKSGKWLPIGCTDGRWTFDGAFQIRDYRQ